MRIVLRIGSSFLELGDAGEAGLFRRQEGYATRWKGWNGGGAGTGSIRRSRPHRGTEG